jgi:hypothetical protein
MYSILLVVEKPPLKEKRNFHEDSRYNDAVTRILQLASKNTSIEVLGENVLLIPIDNALEPLSGVIRNLGDVRYKYTIFSEELKWHEVAKKV